MSRDDSREGQGRDDSRVGRDDSRVGQAIKGSNNGTFGCGMGRGSLFPPSMNGPIGYINFPLPQNISYPAIINGGPKYNAPGWNGPSYNEPAFRSIMGYSNGNVDYMQDGFDMKMGSSVNNNGMILFSPK
jgi:hypothetical protein